MPMLQTSNAGRLLIERNEGLRTSAYQDQRGIWTIGDGHTKDVHPGQTITPEQAGVMLAGDLHDAEHAVNTAVHNCTQNEFDAMVSLCFNIGAGAFASSTLVRLMNAGDTMGAANQFLAWDKTNDQVNKGLLRRRQEERALFLGVAA